MCLNSIRSFSVVVEEVHYAAWLGVVIVGVGVACCVCVVCPLCLAGVGVDPVAEFSYELGFGSVSLSHGIPVRAELINVPIADAPHRWPME